MLRATLGHVCVLAFGLAGSLVLAQEFSADIVNPTKESGGMNKIYVGKDKIRIGIEERKSGPGAIIIDPVEHKNVVLMPERHMYMEGMMGQATPLAFNFWRPQDANDACPQWKETSEKMAERTKSERQLGSCKRIGSDVVNGRSTVKYEGTDADSKKTSYFWVDTKLRFVIKMQTSTGNGFEMQNIQEGAQPGSLFEIPAGYTKFDMGALMKQKQ